MIDVGVIMATEANKALLKESGLLTSEAQSATPNDLVIAVSANDAAADAALLEAERLLKQKRSSDEGAEFRPKTLRGAVKMNPNANIAVISVAGRYATDEAWDALRRGLHVLLFSDNVSLEDEIALKTYARDHGLLLMGPGAGTAILNGVALGFANVVPSGPVGIVSAAGTGLQEVSTLLAKNGVGITQGLGTGGRDLKEEVGGIMMLQALEGPASRSSHEGDRACQQAAVAGCGRSHPRSSGAERQANDRLASWARTPHRIPMRVAEATGRRRTLQETALLAAKAAGANIDVADVIAREETELASASERTSRRVEA